MNIPITQTNMSNKINPFSPWDVKDYVDNKANFVSESCENDMYNSVVVNTNKQADWLESFLTNNHNINYDTAVTHAYLYRNGKQPSVPSEDKPGPQPPGPGPKPEPPAWPEDNTIFYKTSDNGNITINPRTQGRFFGFNGTMLTVIEQGELSEPIIFDTHTEVTRYLKLSGSLGFIYGGAFKNTKNLENIIFPSSLIHVESGEFMLGSGVKTIVFGPDFIGGHNEVQIGSKMFAECLNLEKIYIYSKRTPMFKASSCFAAKDAGNTGEDYSNTIKDFVIYEPQDANGNMVGYVPIGLDDTGSGGQPYFWKSSSYLDYINRLPRIRPIIYS